jgi:hypothetical protein
MLKAKLSLYEQLLRAYDIVEGRHSGIPDCCIQSFVDGVNWNIMINRVKSQKKKVEITNNWSYVPCQDCIDNKRYGLVKSNGSSFMGEILLALMGEAKTADEKNTHNRQP